VINFISSVIEGRIEIRPCLIHVLPDPFVAEAGYCFDIGFGSINCEASQQVIKRLIRLLDSFELLLRFLGDPD
jgi:hypothetical protein